MGKFLTRYGQGVEEKVLIECWRQGIDLSGGTRLALLMSSTNVWLLISKCRKVLGNISYFEKQLSESDWLDISLSDTSLKWKFWVEVLLSDVLESSRGKSYSLYGLSYR